MLPFQIRGTHLLIIQVWSHNGILGSLGVEGSARVEVIGRFLDQACFDRVALDVSPALKIVTFLSDTRASEAFLEDMAGEETGLLEVAGIGELNSMHESGEVVSILNFEEEVKMVRHEAVVIDLNRERLGVAVQMLEEAEVIGIFSEEIPAVIAAVKDVVDPTVNEFSWFTRHGNLRYLNR